MPNAALIPSARTSIGPLNLVIDGYPELEHKLETSIGGEPLEDGRKATDHAVALQAKLKLVAYTRVPERALPALRRLHRESVPVRVATEWGLYGEMLIRRVTAPATARGARIEIELEEIIRVGVTDTELAAGTTSGPAVGRSGEISRGRVALGP